MTLFNSSRNPTLESQYGDPKKMGMFGAPACRCTTIVLALCLALCGLVVLGAGGCIAGFMWSDDTPKSLGFAFVGLGILMMISGLGLYIWDERLKPQSERLDGDSAASRSPQITQTQVVNTIQTDHRENTRPPSQSVYSVQQPSTSRVPEAPPSYDDAINENSVEYRQQKPSGSGVRPSYNAAMHDSQVTSTTAV